MLAIGLIQPCTRLNYLLPRASLITSSADHPKKIKCQISVHVSRKESKVSIECPAARVWYPNLLQTRKRFLQIIWMHLIVLDTVLVPHTVSKLILVLCPSKPLVDQSQCIFKSPSRKRSTRCYKWEF